jgi:hypothetical protein
MKVTASEIEIKEEITFTSGYIQTSSLPNGDDYIVYDESATHWTTVDGANYIANHTVEAGDIVTVNTNYNAQALYHSFDYAGITIKTYE